MGYDRIFTNATKAPRSNLAINLPRRAGVLFLIVSACLAIPYSSVIAQNIQFTEGSIGSGLDNTLQIPLRVYPGRGGASLPITLSYSSRVWRINHLKTIVHGTLLPITEAIYAEHSTAGWTTSLDIPKVERPKNEDTYYYSGKPFCQACGSNFRQFRVARVYINMPDGSKHELRKHDQPYEGPIDMFGTFYAVDGSRLRYDSTGQNTGILYFPDGTRYILNATTAQYIDRNGNTLNYDSATRQWTDTLGRVLGLPLPSNPQAQEYVYTMPGINGPIPYRFRWKHLADALTPDAVTGQIPARKPIANEYLPFPNQPPTPPSGGNYPQFVQTEWGPERPSLFISGTDDLDEGYTTIVGHNQNGGELFNPVVLAEIIFPNELSYKFTYNIYGEIDKVVYPTGGYERYQFSETQPIGHVQPPYSQANRAVTLRQQSPKGNGSDIASWQYSISSFNSTTQIISTTGPDNSYTEVRKHNFRAPLQNGTHSNPRFWPFGFENGIQGMVYEERIYASPGGAMLRRKLTDWTQTANPVPPSIPQLDNTTKTAYRNARSVTEVSLILDTGGEALAKTLTYAYDTTFQLSTGLDLIVSTESHFASVDQNTGQTGVIGIIPSGPLASVAETTYLADPTYRDRNILGLPTAVVLRDSNWQVVSKTESFYDEIAYPLLTYGDLAAPDWIDPGTNARANVTTVRRYFDISANLYLEAHTQFDQCGNARNSWNERGIQSQSEYSAVYKHAYANQATTAVPDPSGVHGSSAAFTSSSTFDYTTGLLLTTTDANGQITNFSYKNDLNVTDPLNRLRKVTQPDGGWSKFEFNDVVGDLFSKTQTKQDDTHISTAYQYVNPMGRLSRSFMSEDGTNYIASDTLYDNLGRVWKTSNPYRTTQRDGNAAESHTGNWTTLHYEALGRVDSLTLPDGSTVQTTYQGIYTTVTDQAGKIRRQKVDALGRIVRVDEPDASGNLGTVDSPSQASHYDYNTQGSVVHILQGTSTQQHRYFKYDALGRLTHERQVEQAGTFTASDPLTGNSTWSRKLIYDETLFGVSYKGLLTSAYDARNILTQYQYDNLNRPVTISYSDGVTPMVTNFYDSVRFTVPSDTRPIHNLGRLTEVQTTALGPVPFTKQAYNYDLMGRAMQNRQTVDTNIYTMGYTYNVGGALTSQTYPSGRVVNYSYDNAARLAQVSSSGTTYANQFNYGNQGLLMSVTLGNGAVQSFAYNSRLQLKSLDLTKSGTQLQHYDYKYGVYDPGSNTLDETKNNGQIAQIEGFIGAQKQWQQRFAYDSLGRLKSAREHRGDNNQQSYLTNYDYDLFGNRYQSQAQNSGNPFAQTWVEAGQISQTDNRYTSGVTYDAAGNITQDTKFRNLQFQYDATNRQRWSANLNGSGAVTAVFDGGGQRLATISNGVITNISVYDAMGKLVAEYGEGSPTNRTQYLMSDHQGTPRVVMKSSGTAADLVRSRHDYLPFGEEIFAGVGIRTTAQFYNQTDGVTPKYAGMEKDEASGMAHTLWRKYDSSSGRWTTTDPYGGSLTIADPQSFNRYTYVNNDPVNQIDPTGLMLSDIGVYQFEDPRDARMAEQQSLRDFQMAVNAEYAARNGGSVSYDGNRATFQNNSKQPKVFDITKDKTIAKKVEQINKEAKPLPSNQTPVLTNVAVIAGDTVDVNGEIVRDAYGRETKDPFTGTIRPVAYVPLDQGGNIIPDESGIGVQEIIQRNGGKPERIPNAGLAPAPPGGVFFDMQLIAKGEPTMNVKQHVLVAQLSRTGNIVSQVLISPNSITLTPMSAGKAGSISVTTAQPRKL